MIRPLINLKNLTQLERFTLDIAIEKDLKDTYPYELSRVYGPSMSSLKAIRMKEIIRDLQQKKYFEFSDSIHNLDSSSSVIISAKKFTSRDKKVLQSADVYILALGLIEHFYIVPREDNIEISIIQYLRNFWKAVDIEDDESLKGYFQRKEKRLFMETCNVLKASDL